MKVQVDDEKSASVMSEPLTRGPSRPRALGTSLSHIDTYRMCALILEQCHKHLAAASPRPSRCLQRRLRHIACASSKDQQQQQYVTYSYQSSSGPPKVTIEDVFGPIAAAEQGSNPSSPEVSAPWGFGYQVSERNLMWNDDLKVQLIKRIASEQLGISDEEMEWRLSQLGVLLPGLVPRLLRAPPILVARAAAHTSEVAQRLLILKQTFPTADISTMVSNRLTLLLDDNVDTEELRQLLPGLNVDLFVADFPLVLDVNNFKMALEDCKRLMPDKDAVELLRSNPSIVLGLVKGNNLLVYDQLPNPWE